MKKTIFILLLALCSCQCFQPVKQTDEQIAKDINDLKAENKSLRIINALFAHRDSLYQDSLRECRNDNAQLEYWKNKSK